jgi:predicted TIM-barrel fold metal-dependent hydrolase
MIINCHCHIFDLSCVPPKFKERFGINLKNPVHKTVFWLLRRFLPSDCAPAHFLGIAEKSILEIAQKLVQEMDAAGYELCTPLMMDMEYNSAFGGGTKAYQQQIEETAAACEAINAHNGRVRMLPFIAADPRRPNVTPIVTDALASSKFKGVKIYPVMDYFPNDERLFDIYQYCLDHHHPLTAHCANEGIPGFEKYYWKCDPDHWEKVLEKFPALVLNLAHNDRTGESWQPKIARLIQKYDNVYTDISFDTEMWYMPKRYFQSVKKMLNTPKIQDRVLYGTDWYMGRFLWDETTYFKWYTEYAKQIFWCRVEFTSAEMKRLTEDNPKRFLGI